MIRVLGDRVLVALPPKVHEQEAATGYTFQPGHTTASGLILAKPADVYNDTLATQGIVVALGEKRGQVDLDDVLAELNELKSTAEKHECGRLDGVCCVTTLEAAMDEIRARRPAPFDVEVGECVIFSASAGEQISEDGVSYVILHEHEILGVVAPTKEAA
jgi:co-chaperonin GroES (HSP10)